MLDLVLFLCIYSTYMLIALTSLLTSWKWISINVCITVWLIVSVLAWAWCLVFQAAWSTRGQVVLAWQACLVPASIFCSVRFITWLAVWEPLVHASMFCFCVCTPADTTTPPPPAPPAPSRKPGVFHVPHTSGRFVVCSVDVWCSFLLHPIYCI